MDTTERPFQGEISELEAECSMLKCLFLVKLHVLSINNQLSRLLYPWNMGRWKLSISSLEHCCQPDAGRLIRRTDYNSRWEVKFAICHVARLRTYFFFRLAYRVFGSSLVQTLANYLSYLSIDQSRKIEAK